MSKEYFFIKKMMYNLVNNILKEIFGGGGEGGGRCRLILEGKC